MAEEIITCLEGVAPRTRILMQDLTQADRATKVISDSIKDEENAILQQLVDAITKGAEVDFDDVLRRKVSLRARREDLVEAADASSRHAHSVYAVVDEAIAKTDDKINVLNARLKDIVDTRERKKEKKSAGEHDSILGMLLESGGIMGAPAASWGGGLGSGGGASSSKRGSHGRSGSTSAGAATGFGEDAAGGEGEDGEPVDPHEPVYCICRRVASGRMVGCENEEDCGEWFHFECVGLAPETPEKDLDGWICPNCIASGYIRKIRKFSDA